MKIFILFFIGIIFSQNTKEQLEFMKVTKCVACRFIWENIEEAMGKSQRNSILAAEAFQYYCKISPDIFFQPCNEMFEKLYDMSEKFTQKQTVTQICQSSEMCESPLLAKNTTLSQASNKPKGKTNSQEVNLDEEEFNPLSFAQRKLNFLQRQDNN